MPNQAALTCLDFQHIKQVGLSIEVTPREPRGSPRCWQGREGPPALGMGMGKGGRSGDGGDADLGFVLLFWDELSFAVILY